MDKDDAITAVEKKQLLFTASLFLAENLYAFIYTKMVHT